MILKSKIINILIIVLTAVSLSSCKKNKYDVIPDVTIDFAIDLNDPEFFVLNAATNSMVITSATNNWGIYSAGFDNDGIIVYRSAMDEFHAYDRTCPHDYVVNGLSIKVNVDFISAICPRCSTYYSLEANGTPSAGPGKYPLKNYKTSFDGRFIHVRNPF